jgi:hypothetical protein
MLDRTRATKADFDVRAADGVELRGWKVRPPGTEWRLAAPAFRTIARCPQRSRDSVTPWLQLRDDGIRERTGEATAIWLLTNGKERYDTIAINSTERVSHLDALGVSMGAAIALRSAAAESRIEGVIAQEIHSPTSAK